MKVRQFIGAKHHFVLFDEESKVEILQSYDSRIVKTDRTGKVTLGKNWKCSRTTSKYRAIYLGESTKTTQEKLDSGEYLYDENL